MQQSTKQNGQNSGEEVEQQVSQYSFVDHTQALRPSVPAEEIIKNDSSIEIDNPKQIS